MIKYDKNQKWTRSSSRYSENNTKSPVFLEVALCEILHVHAITQKFISKTDVNISYFSCFKNGTIRQTVIFFILHFIKNPPKN